MKIKKFVTWFLIVVFITSYFNFNIFASNSNAKTINIANVRSDAGVVFDVIETLQPNEPVEIIGKELGWYKIKTKSGKAGFVTYTLLKDIDQKVFDTYNPIKNNYVELSTYTTKFSVNDKNRNHNIELSAYKNNKILKPNEIFSFNTNTGNSTLTSNGWKSAGVIINKEFDVGVGGGICQTSSTIHSNIMQDSSMKIIERRKHSIPVGYVPVSFEAMVNYGSSDFRFKNTNNFDVFVYNYVNQTSGKITSTLYKIDSTIPEIKPEPEIPKLTPEEELKIKIDTSYTDYIKALKENPKELLKIFNINTDGGKYMAFDIKYFIDDIDKDGYNDLLIDFLVAIGIDDTENYVGYSYILKFKDDKIYFSTALKTFDNVENILGQIGLYEDENKNLSWFLINYSGDAVIKIGENFELEVDSISHSEFKKTHKVAFVDYISLGFEDFSLIRKTNSDIINNSPPKIIVNNEEVNYSIPPQNINDKIYIEMRSLFENLGYIVDYNEETKVIQISNEEELLILQNGSSSIEIIKITPLQEEIIPLDFPLILINDRTMFSLRTAGEILGYKVSWDGENNTAFLNLE